MSKGKTLSLFNSLRLSGIVLCILALTGCSQETQTKGVALAEAGSAAANVMADYYDGLAEGENDNFEASIFRDRLSAPGAEPKANEQGEKEERDARDKYIVHFRARARAARQLGATYKALKDLASYNATEEVKASAGALATELQGIKVLPENIGTASVNALSQTAAGLLISARQSKDIRKGAAALNKTVNGFASLISDEAPVYKSRNSIRLVTLKGLLTDLNTTKFSNGNILFNKAAKIYHLESFPGTPSTATPAQVLAVQGLIDHRHKDLDESSGISPVILQQTISELQNEQTKFMNKESMTLGYLVAKVNSMADIVDDIFPKKE